MFALRIAYGHCLLLQRFSEVAAYLRNGALCNMTSLPTQEPMMAIPSEAGPPNRIGRITGDALEKL